MNNKSIIKGEINEKRKEQLNELTDNFREFLASNKEKYRLRELFLSEKEVNFLNNCKFSNLFRMNKQDFLEVIYEGFEYRIGIYPNENMTKVWCKEYYKLNEYFLNDDTKSFLYDYLRDSGTLIALKDIEEPRIIIS